MKFLLQVKIIPRNRSYYIFFGLILASLLFSATTTTFLGAYSYIQTYLGNSQDVLILTEEGSGNTIATSFIDVSLAKSASYLNGVIVSSPETITPCVIENQIFMARGVDFSKFSQIDDLTIIQGQSLTSNNLNGAILGYRVAQKLNLEIGSKFIVFSSLRDITLELEVVGIFSSSKNSLNDEIIIPLSLGQWMAGHYPSKCTFIRIKFQQEITSKNKLQEIIMRKHNLNLTIKNYYTNLPIQGAEVKVYDINKQIFYSRSTDSTGNLNFNLPFGNYTLNISYNGIKKSESIFLLNDLTKTINLSIYNPHYQLIIRLYNQTSPISKRVVTCWHNSEMVFMGQTNDSGILKAWLPQEEYKISTFYWNDYSKTQIEFTQYVNLNKNMTINFFFRNYSLGINVFDTIKQSLIDCLVQIKNLNGTLIDSGYSGNDGYIQFSNLLPDYYNISVIVGQSKKFKLITLKSDLILHFYIYPFFKLNVSVINSTNHNLLNANITIINTENNISIFNSTGTNGFWCTSLESRVYKIIYTVSGYSNSTIINLIKDTNLSFWCPPYNVLIKIIGFNYSAISNANVSIYNDKFKVSAISNLTGEINLKLYPDFYNITINSSRKIYSTNLIVNDINEYLQIMIPPYNLTLIVFNGSFQENISVENLSIRIVDIENSSRIFNGTTDKFGKVSWMLYPGKYNISITVDSKNYSKIVEIRDNNQIINFYTPPYNLTINITSALNSKPIENATIIISTYPESQEIYTANSSSSGIVSILLQKSGDYNVTIKYLNTLLSQIINVNSDPILNFLIPPYNISILVYDANGPITNSNVSISSIGWNLTNSNGIAYFVLDQGEYNITAIYGNLSNTVQLNLKETNPNTFVKIKLAKRFNLDIKVIESVNNKPIKNALVRIYNNFSLVAQGITDINGSVKFILDITESNLYNVSIYYHNINQYRFINLTKDTALNFSIIRTNLVKIKVLNGFDAPFQYAKINIISTNNVINEQLFTNDLGLGQIYLETGSYNITVEKNGYYKKEILDIWCDRNLIFYLPPYKLNVIVKNTSNDLVSGVLVEVLLKNGSILYNNYTNINGEAVFSMCEDEYIISVSYKGNTWSKNINTYNLNSTINLLFSIASNFESKYLVANPISYSSSLLEQTFGLTKSIIYILTIIITLLVSLSIMNVVSSSLNESRKFIGIIKALGGNNFQIFLVSGFKILIISLAAGVIGGISGAFLGSIISFIGFQLYITELFTTESFLQLISLSLIINLIISSIASFYTLFNLNKLSIAESLREILKSK
ncbi:MAG: ABC transporter permease [Candidatus Helarchaeota archaeon]